MSRDRVVDVALRVAPVLVAIGIAWGVLTAQVSSKLAASRFLVDSTVTHGALGRMQQSLDSANAGIRKIICRQNPNDSVCPP